LQALRRHITQKMPIRLLCFEPCHSKFKISLLERADIYDYLAPKVRADFSHGQPLSYHFGARDYLRYAILSHTWNQTPGELTFSDWQRISLDEQHPKCRKLVNFCKAAWKDHGLTLGWIDTVCINKESSAELDESIRSMYTWYSNAEVCITYLAGTEILSNIHNDPWFTRGWTLQELVAPYRIKFYDMYWTQFCCGPLSDKLGDKEDSSSSLIQQEITLATSITRGELQNIQHTPISRRMELVAKRQVTREEDIAYCLMGLFDVSISTAYGEGVDRAFFRLMEEIFRSTKDVSDIFNWAGGRTSVNRQPITSLFPSRPSDYLSRSPNAQLHPWHPIKPLILTHLGLRIPILLMPAMPIRELESVLDYQPIGDYHCSTITIAPFSHHLNGNRVILPKYYHLLDKRVSGPNGAYTIELWETTMKLNLAFGILNVEELGTKICIPKTCLAVFLELFENERSGIPSVVCQKVYTKEPIVFDLKKTGNDGLGIYYQIERSQLEIHGMKLVTLSL
jgi:hypothetical protein